MKIETMTLTGFLLARIAERDLFWETVGESGQAHPDRVARYRAESEAMRRIVELHGTDYSTRRPGRHLCEDEMISHDECQTLRALAAVYADHPDYREDDWKP